MCLFFVQAAFRNSHDDFCQTPGVKKNDFQRACWDYAHGRFKEATLSQRQYHGETESVEPPIIDLTGAAASSGAASSSAASVSPQPAAPEASSRPAASDSAAAAEKGTDAPGFNEQVFQQHVARWSEEDFCREQLDNLTWATSIPVHVDTKEQMLQVRNAVEKYMENFEHGVTHQWDIAKFPLNPRIWIAETIWTLEALNATGHLPVAMTQPGDKHIREDAGNAADGFDDPGNLELDIVVNVLRLWKFVSGFKVEAVRRIAPGEYGSRGNKSSKGPVNLRGNIIEAASIQLQKMAKQPEGKGTYGQSYSKPGSSGLPLDVSYVVYQ
jgi:hypothetical protein